MMLPTLHPDLGFSLTLLSLISMGEGGGIYIQKGLLLLVLVLMHHRSFFLLILPAHFYIVSTATIKLLHILTLFVS